MRALLASTLCLSLGLTSCFPTNPRARTIAKLSEGGVIVAGIAMLSIVNSGAECDAKGQPGVPDSNCHSTANALGDIGFGLILTGLIGFIATVSTAPDDKPDPPAAVTAPPPPPKP